ncbi:MAG: radical SAM protein [Bacillota bacterium]|nr:radical SAM protein [Bacillota bacterium]
MADNNMLRTFDSTVLPIMTCCDKVLDILDNKIPVPNVAEFFITNFCNFRCRHCRCMKTLTEDKYAYMDLDFFSRVLKDLAGIGVKCVHLAGGGEPLIHPYIIDILKLIKNCNMKTAIYTNGYSFTESPELIETALETCDSIRISLDAASEATMKKVHGMDNISYSKLYNSLCRMISLRGRLPKIGLKMLISKLNVSDIKEFVQQGVLMGADYLQFRFLTFPKGLSLEPEEVKTLTTEISEYISLYSNCSTQIEVVPSYESDSAAGKCLASLLHTVIDYDGEVYICPFFETRKSSHRLGSLKTAGSFSDLWYSQEHLKVRENIDYSKCVANCQMLRYNKVIDFISSDGYRFDFI